MIRTLTALTLTAAMATAATGCQHTGDTDAAAAADGRTADRIDLDAARADLAALQVATEDTGNHYRREDWPHWDRVAGECDARENALRTQGRDVTTGPHCTVTAGTWTSPYDGVTVTSPDALDIDHMVPLAEAARSGTRAWSRADRERYANDPAVLVAVTAKTNRGKGDQDPARWLPPLDHCTYVARWIAVKHAYGMTVDRAERAAITGVLNHC
ncbi:HNH endonuclease family protein [Amycolatopsis sp. NPDC005961]|uniref:HNH endonuclease family protein n=1 Tax=Amycolatopsis sp. NPDC005961 TaxID=3156720 RepID=UPI00340527E6